MIVDIGLLF